MPPLASSSSTTSVQAPRATASAPSWPTSMLTRLAVYSRAWSLTALRILAEQRRPELQPEPAPDNYLLRVEQVDQVGGGGTEIKSRLLERGLSGLVGRGGLEEPIDPFFGVGVGRRGRRRGPSGATPPGAPGAPI